MLGIRIFYFYCVKWPFVLLQVYSFKRKAIQMYRMWQRVLPVENSGRTQSFTPGRVATQVSSLQPQLQPAIQPENPPSNAHTSRHVFAEQHRICSPTSIGSQCATTTGSTTTVSAATTATATSTAEKAWLHYCGNHESQIIFLIIILFSIDCTCFLSSSSRRTNFQAGITPKP